MLFLIGLVFMLVMLRTFTLRMQPLLPRFRCWCSTSFLIQRKPSERRVVSQNEGAELQPPFGITATRCVCSAYFGMLRRKWIRGLRKLTKSTCRCAVQANFPNYGNRLV